MKLYRTRIHLRSSYITPWQSDTLMGSLCWALKETCGEEALAAFLAQCRQGRFPFVLSDCFPGDLLPRPLAGNYIDPESTQTLTEAMTRFSAAKKAKKASYVTTEEFNIIAGGGTVDLEPHSTGTVAASIVHSSVSRLSNTVLAGSLYEQEEYFSAGDHMSLYARVEDSWLERFTALLEHLSRRGFGRGVSVGKGAFEANRPEPFDALEAPLSPNAVIMLSNYIPAPSDPIKGQYRSFIKYGKLGAQYSFLANPFKKPVMMFRPGAVFFDAEPKPYYGRVAEGVSAEKEEVVHFGCALAVPARVAKPDR